MIFSCKANFLSENSSLLCISVKNVRSEFSSHVMVSTIDFSTGIQISDVDPHKQSPDNFENHQKDQIIVQESYD